MALQTSLRIKRGTIGSGEDHAGSSYGRADRARACDAHTDRAGGLISGTGNDGSSNSQARGFGPGRGNFPADLRRFKKRGQQLLIDRRLAENFRRPTPIGYVEQQSAGSVGHVDGALPGEAEAHVVFGQHHVRHASPVLRLILTHPKQFGEREIGERRIAGQANQIFAAE